MIEIMVNDTLTLHKNLAVCPESYTGHQDHPDYPLHVFSSITSVTIVPQEINIPVRLIFPALQVCVSNPAGLAKMILQGTVQGGRRKGRQKKRWEDNVMEWTGLKLGEALERLKIEKGGEKWLPNHPWCPNGQLD